MEKLSDFFKGSSDNISVIAASHEEIFASIKQISGSLSNQSKELIDISANVSGLCLVTEEIASAAKGVQELSEEAADFARNGKQAALKATERFQEQVGRSSNIQKIIEMIREISDKTNLLALNAAIEAARAGQHGLGFSVVADEINKLASLTMSRVNEISKDVSAMLSAQSEGHKLVTASTSHMESIADSVERIREFLRTMNTMIEEQLDGTRGMALTVNSVTEGSLQIDRAINEQNLALRELNQGVNRLVIDLNDASVDSDSTSRSTNETLIDSRHDIESREDEL
ncbi:methyl-accepting chemotaxis protein [Leptospira ellisii]|uniref:Methyl-accepting chemotaxis protein n=1 Tax=Leptospira ellisii TaxID=2023197 RepID=A0AAE4TWW5_9LEPT|nr:methyl-accepting chemotaxis protein [Leptospira ellisii]MDV6236648.1 methyl-accepting chemotaxis protein [Leptospira ellisii]